MTDILPVCFIVDENMYTHLETVCKSLLKQVSIPIHFCILTNNEENIPKISLILELFSKNYTIKSLLIEDLELLNFFYLPEERTDIAKFGYSQLLFPKYFTNFKKILFLEPDQIVRSDLAYFWREIWEKDIKLCAVDYKIGSKTMATLTKLYPGRIVKCYNAGVMIVDTEFWINNDFTGLCFDVVKKQKDTNGTYYDYYAEGAINVALQTYIVEADPKFNTCNLGWSKNIDKKIIEKGIILHWNGPQKPWKPDGLYKSYYSL